MAENDAEKERKAKAERAKKLLAQRKKKKAATALDTPTPSSPGSTLADPPAVSSARTSLSLDESARAELDRAEVKDSKPSALKETDIKSDSVRDKTEEEAIVANSDDGPKAAIEGEAPVVEAEKLEASSVQPENAVETKVEDAEKVNETAAESGEAQSPPSVPIAEVKATNTPQRKSRPSIVQSPSAESLTNLQQTVSLLIAERSDLQTQISALQSQLASAKGDSQLLEEGRTLITQLEEGKRELEERVRSLESNASKVKGLEDIVASTRKEVRELDGQRDELQSDKARLEKELNNVNEKEKERVGELEKAVERSREREGGLEAEVGRLRQSNTELSNNLEIVTRDLESIRTSSSTTDTAHSELQETHQTLQTNHKSLSSEHANLRDTHNDLTSTHDGLRKSHDTLSSSLATLETTVSTTKSELESTKSKLASANKRAEAAEKRRTGLQNENDELVKQLEEVRGKVVAIMEEKVTLAGEIESWETKSRTWEKTKTELEAQTEEAKSLHEQVSALAEENQTKADRIAVLEGGEMQHRALQAEHEKAQSTISERENEISSFRSRLEVTDAKVAELNETIFTLRSQLETALQSTIDRDATIAAFQAENSLSISTLQSELETFRASSTPLPLSPENSSDLKPSSDVQSQASLDALRASHSLEQSTLQAQIRNLENALHASENRIHELSKQLVAYAKAQKERDDSVYSPSGSRIASRGGAGGYFLSPKDEYPSPGRSTDLALANASALGYGLPQSPSASSSVTAAGSRGGSRRPTSMVDAILPASVRHKRQISLNALKARMQAESTHTTNPTLKRMETLTEIGTEEDSTSGPTTPGRPAQPPPGGYGQRRRKQFGDEIMFCCPACEGDLITL